MEKFGFDDPQASAIVAFRLGQLAGLEIKKIEAELGELNENVEQTKSFTASEVEQIRSFLNDLLAEVAKNGK